VLLLQISQLQEINKAVLDHISILQQQAGRLSGGARVLDQGGPFFLVRHQISLPIGRLYKAPLWGASIGHLDLATPMHMGGKRIPYGAPLPPEAPYSIHQPQNKLG